MSRLLLLRHGEALPGMAAGDDRARPLSARGRIAAGAVAAHLEREGIRPDVALCSTALRARQTLEPIRGHVRALTVHLEDELYLAAAPTLAARLARVEHAARCVLLVGHNPGISHLALWLDPDARDRLRMPPTALAILRLRVEAWHELASGGAGMESLIFGEQLPPAGEAGSA